MGSVNLDNTGSGSAITLSSDGTDLLLNGTAIGGGGGGSPDLFADNDVSATAPSATGDNSVAIGPSSEANSADATAFGYRSEAKASKAVAIGEGRAGGTSATAISIGTTSTAYGATGTRSVAMGYQAKATGLYAFALGANSVSTGQESFAIGKSLASGTESFAAAIDTNTTSYGASGANSVAIGKNAQCTNTGFAIGYQTQSTAAGATVLGYGSIGSGSGATALGKYAKASGFGSIAISGEPSGYYTEASGRDSVAIGNRALASTRGKMAYTAKVFSDNGDAQQGTFVLLSDTTDATAEAMTTSKGTAGTDNQIILPNNSSYTFSGTVVAREKASEGTDVGAWEIKGIIRREANAGTTVLVNSVINELNVPTGWAVALTADTTNGCLKVEVTGVLATNIRWVATINTSEVTYA